MPIQVTEPLFAWDCLEDSRTLKTITQLLGGLPGAALVDWRGAGHRAKKERRQSGDIRSLPGPVEQER